MELIQVREQVRRLRDNKLNEHLGTWRTLSIDKKGRRLIVLTLCDETLESLVMLTESKQQKVDKEDKKDLLPIMWFVVPKSKTQLPRESELVRSTKDVHVCLIEVMELEFWQSSHH